MSISTFHSFEYMKCLEFNSLNNCDIQYIKCKKNKIEKDCDTKYIDCISQLTRQTHKCLKNFQHMLNSN